MNRLSILFPLILASTQAFAQAYLAPLSNGYGPFDYTDPENRRTKLEVVEKYHFNEGIRSLTSGMNSSVWADLNYVIRAFPNHHLALETLGRLLRMKDSIMSRELYDERYRGMPPEVTAEAYFEYAIRFSPQDGISMLLYGIHLHKTGKREEALDQYLKAKQIGNIESADLEYNTGLVYAELKQYDKAVDHAIRAYQLGHPLPGLRNMLTRAGVWPNQQQIQQRTALQDNQGAIETAVSN